MNEKQPVSSSKNRPSDTISESPVLLGSAVLILLTAFCWGLYLEAAIQVADNPFKAYHLRNDLGFLTCSMAALFFVSLSAAMLYKGSIQSQWSLLEARIFYLGVNLDAIYLLTGFQYILFGEWYYPNVGWFLTVKGTLIVVLALQLVRVVRQVWFQNPSP